MRHSHSRGRASCPVSDATLSRRSFFALAVLLVLSPKSLWRAINAVSEHGQYETKIFHGLGNGRVIEIDSAIQRCVARAEKPALLEFGLRAIQQFHDACFSGQTPMLTFWGKADNLSNLAGGFCVEEYQTPYGMVGVKINASLKPREYRLLAV
jgi:hypothetical protein